MSDTVSTPENAEVTEVAEVVDELAAEEAVVEEAVAEDGRAVEALVEAEAEVGRRRARDRRS